MRKIIYFAAILMLAACGESQRGYLAWRGLPMDLSATAFADSLEARGFSKDTAQSTASQLVFTSPKESYVVAIRHENDTLTDVFEQYHATYNDSTANLWQQMHDQLEKELGQWPGMTHRADLHKEAVFDTEKGTVVLTLLNTYTPTLTLHYSNTIVEK